MNPAQLLYHFDRISKAPDAVSRLRRFILDLAVRGKLVPQDLNDEPAPVLLERSAVASTNQVGLPSGWCRATVGTLLDFQYGKTMKASERVAKGPVPVYGSNGIVGYTVKPLTVSPSIIIGRKGSAGALNLCDGPSWTTDVAYFVESPAFFDIRFLLSVLETLNLQKLSKGVKPGLSRSDAYRRMVDVPPLAEQRRIVAKVDELNALCDELEANLTATQSEGSRLIEAVLHEALTSARGSAIAAAR